MKVTEGMIERGTNAVLNSEGNQTPSPTDRVVAEATARVVLNAALAYVHEPKEHPEDAAAAPRSTKLPEYKWVATREMVTAEYIGLVLGFAASLLCLTALVASSIPDAIVGLGAWWGVGSIYQEVENSEIGPRYKYELDS